MSSMLLTDWTTVRSGGGSVTSIAQGESEWIDLGDYVDATFWVDCREVTGAVQLLLETSPSKDESLFVSATPAVTLASGGTPQVVQVRTVTSQVTAPLARFLRWRLSGPGTAWDATFRIGMTGTPFGYFAPTQLAGCVLWLRADLGVTLATSPAISAWGDQSGVGNNFSQGTAANQPTLVTSGASTINGLPAIKFANSPSVQFLQSTAGNTYVQPNSIFFVWFQSATGTEQFLDGAASSGNRQQLLTPAGSTTSLQLNAGGTTQAVTVGSYAVPNIIEVDWNGASTQVFQNGGAPVTVGATPGGNSWSIGTIGATQTGTTGVQASFAEFIAFSQLPSANDRTRLVRYLGGRYGIAVP